MGSSLTKTKEQQPDISTLQTPISTFDENESSTNDDDSSSFPKPTGKEYELIDQIASELPHIIDDESKRQVDEYISSCDNGSGPMVACFSTAEYLSLFERKHQEAADLYENTCFRPKSDKSPNGVEVDGTKAYPPSCYNLARMRMTGKGRTKFDRKEGYELFDRGCRGGHDPSCVLQAKMLTSPPGSLEKEGIPYDPYKAMELYDRACQNRDSHACFALGTMLLRGDLIDPKADNVTPQEARGEVEIKRRRGEMDRKRKDDEKRIPIKRDPPRAEEIFIKGCDAAHAPSCFNLAVMYDQGDDGVSPNQEKADQYKKKTEELVKLYGGFGG